MEMRRGVAVAACVFFAAGMGREDSQVFESYERRQMSGLT